MPQYLSVAVSSDGSPSVCTRIVCPGASTVPCANA